MKAPTRVIVIGAGMAGVLAAIRLREAGYDDVAVYEKATSVGGTWRENAYPGLTCDVPSHLYSYSFAPNPQWSHCYAPGPEIRRYFEDTAKRYGVHELIRFGEEVETLRFDGNAWQLSTKGGTTDRADFVIGATGVLHHPNVPSFPGLETFAGAAFHSARWPGGLETAGKRVGVVGTGSTATQIIGALAGNVDSLTVFQRTPQWIMPIENPRYTDDQRSGFEREPARIKAIRDEVKTAFVDGFANVLVDAESPLLEAIHQACEAHLEASVPDPELRARLRPDYRATCKRLVMSTNFYEAIQTAGTRLVTEPIERVEPNGPRTADGELHELDVLVLATGFRVDRFLRPIRVTGLDGIALDDVWGDSPSAYLALGVPDFPNLFMVNGPNGPVGNFSLIDVAELQIHYILQLLERVRSGDCERISVSHAAMDAFNRERIEAAKSTIWNSGCRSWYLDKHGVPIAWPFTYDRFEEEMAKPDFEHYETS